MRKILFAGQTGLKKKIVLEILTKEIEKHCPEFKNLVKVYELKDYIKRATGENPAQFPAMKSLAKMRQAWIKGWDLLSQTIKEENPTGCSLISVHLVYFRYSRPVAPVLPNLFAERGPDTIVSLIDDLFAVRSRINFEGYHFTLRDLYTWRMMEWLMADQTAWAIGKAKQLDKHIPHFVLSVKHPVHMLFRLLFRPNIPIVYASFPISATRDCEEKRREIDRFRSGLHRLFAVFDPLTIDERIMDTWAVEAKTNTICFDFKKGPPKRWDCRVVGDNDRDCNYNPLIWDDELGTAEIPVAEIQDLLNKIQEENESIIDDHITFRDYRLIDQADYVICYRPYYQNEYHGGVDDEISYANDTSRLVYAFVSNDIKPKKPLKGRIDKSYNNEAKFWEEMEKLSKAGPDSDLRKGRIIF